VISGILHRSWPLLPKTLCQIQPTHTYLDPRLLTPLQVALKVVFLGRRDLTEQQRDILASEAKFLRMVRGCKKGGREGPVQTGQ